LTKGLKLPTLAVLNGVPGLLGLREAEARFNPRNLIRVMPAEGYESAI